MKTKIQLTVAGLVFAALGCIIMLSERASNDPVGAGFVVLVLIAAAGGFLYSGLRRNPFRVIAAYREQGFSNFVVHERRWTDKRGKENPPGIYARSPCNGLYRVGNPDGSFADDVVRYD